jgi:hypothetical protein
MNIKDLTVEKIKNKSKCAVHVGDAASLGRKRVMSPSPEALDMHLVFSVQEEEHAEPTKYPTKNIALALR